MVHINKVKVVIFVVNKVLYSINKVQIKMFYLISNKGTCRNKIKTKKGRLEIILLKKKSGNEK